MTGSHLALMKMSEPLQASSQLDLETTVGEFSACCRMRFSTLIYLPFHALSGWHPRRRTPMNGGVFQPAYHVRHNVVQIKKHSMRLRAISKKVRQQDCVIWDWLEVEPGSIGAHFAVYPGWRKAAFLSPPTTCATTWFRFRNIACDCVRFRNSQTTG